MFGDKRSYVFFGAWFRLRTFLFYSDRVIHSAKTNKGMKTMNVKFKSVCKIDGAGRIVIPVTLRKMLGITADDLLSVTLTEDKITIDVISPQKVCTVEDFSI